MTELSGRRASTVFFLLSRPAASLKQPKHTDSDGVALRSASTVLQKPELCGRREAQKTEKKLGFCREATISLKQCKR